MNGFMQNQMGPMEKQIMKQLEHSPSPLPMQLRPLFEGTIRRSGGDMNHGLGWLILLLGIGAAALPWLAPTLDESARKKIILIGLGAGSVLLLYILVQNIRFVGLGIFITLAGYFMDWTGVFKDNRWRLPISMTSRVSNAASTHPDK
jgi:hypothetical protein